MGDYDSLAGIVMDVKKMKKSGMSDEEIDLVLEADGVEAAYRNSAMRRAAVQ